MSQDSSDVNVGLEKLKTWIIVLLMAVGILTYGLVVYTTIGDRGTPGWSYGSVADVPGESPFSSEPLR